MLVWMTIACGSTWNRAVDIDTALQQDSAPRAHTDSASDLDSGGDSAIDTSTPGTASDEVWITQVGHNCDSIGFWIDAYTTGRANYGELWLEETGASSPWGEEHYVPLYSSSPADGTNLYVELDTVASVKDLVSGGTTLFWCEDENSLTWLLKVYDGADVYADCVTWGHDPGHFGAKCRNAL